MTLITASTISTPAAAPAAVAPQPQLQPLPPAPVPAPDAWPGASRDKIDRKILAINTWRAEVASQQDVITCACSNGSSSPLPPLPGSADGGAHHSRPQSCEVCRRPASSSAADDSSNANGRAKSKGSSSSRAGGRSGSGGGGGGGGGGLGSVRRVLRRLGTGHKSSKTSTSPNAAESRQPSAADVTRMYATQQELANAAGEDSDDEGSSEAGGLMGREARLRRAQRLLARHHNGNSNNYQHHGGQPGGVKGGADTQHGQGPGR